MMRYSGQVKVSIRFDDREDQYVANVQTPGGKRVVHVRPPARPERAVDSPEAYDDAARAAITFADHEGHDVYDYLSIDESGTVHIGRAAMRAWTRESNVVRKKAKKRGLRKILAALKDLK